jgi:hypothetical protein
MSNEFNTALDDILIDKSTSTRIKHKNIIDLFENQNREQIKRSVHGVNMNTPDLYVLAKPIVEYLRTNYHPHVMLTITSTNIILHEALKGKHEPL